MPGDISRSYKGPKDGGVPSWMDEPSEPTLPKPRKGWEKSLNEQAAEHPPSDNPRDVFAAPDRTSRD